MTNFWIAREFKEYPSDKAVECEYRLFKTKPRMKVGFLGKYWVVGEDDFGEGLCPLGIHKLTDIRLKVGGGPLKAQVGLCRSQKV
jgi:hypothetical protein